MFKIQREYAMEQQSLWLWLLGKPPGTQQNSRDHKREPELAAVYKELDMFAEQRVQTLPCCLQLNWRKSSSRDIIFVCSFHRKAKLTLNNNPSYYSTGLSPPFSQRSGAPEANYLLSWIKSYTPHPSFWDTNSPPTSVFQFCPIFFYYF